jgi:hypothetical protein
VDGWFADLYDTTPDGRGRAKAFPVMDVVRVTDADYLAHFF